MRKKVKKPVRRKIVLRPTVLLFLGQGKDRPRVSSMTMPTGTPSSVAERGVILADIMGRGRDDIIVSNGSAGTIALFLRSRVQAEQQPRWTESSGQVLTNALVSRNDSALTRNSREVRLDNLLILF